MHISDLRSSSPEIVEHHDIAAVIDLLPMSLPDTEPLLSCLEGNIDQYVMLSSSDVYRNYELLHRHGSGSPIFDDISETSPLRVTRHPYRRSSRGLVDDPNRYLDDYDKIPVENLVRELTVGWTILRLPMIYGPGDKLRRFRWAIAHMANSSDPLVAPRDFAEWTTTYGHRDNVAAAIALTVGTDEALRRTFNVGESAPVNHLQ
jgi:nucleoside-diphosphate-sugar epimerase